MTAPSHSAGFLEALEGCLARLLEAGPRRDLPLLSAARQLTLAPRAKRLRPRLVWVAAETLGVGGAALVDAAVAGELTHNASLLHDDVVDEGQVRRGQPTANATFGNPFAVLAGDLLLTVALEQLAPHPPVLLQALVGVVRLMSEASMREIASRGRLDLDLETWRDIASGKTGELFGWCCAAPARLTGARDEAERLRRCGQRLGVAFQMADDLLDLEPRPSGKDRFSDLRERTPSFPLLVGLGRSPALRRQVAGLWSGATRKRETESIGAALLELGVARDTERAIDDELDQARAELPRRLTSIVDRVTQLWGSRESARAAAAV